MIKITGVVVPFAWAVLAFIFSLLNDTITRIDEKMDRIEFRIARQHVQTIDRISTVETRFSERLSVAETRIDNIEKQIKN